LLLTSQNNSSPFSLPETINASVPLTPNAPPSDNFVLMCP
jgi:hypothetical protein